MLKNTAARIAHCGEAATVPAHRRTRGTAPSAPRGHMPFIRPLLVPSLALLAVSAAAADPTDVGAGGQLVGPGGTVIETRPGRLQGGGRQVFLQGLIDLDYLQQANYRDGNSNLSDRRNQAWLRAEMGTRIEVDNRVEVSLTVGYQGVAGSSQPTDNGSIYGGTTSNGPINGSAGNAVLDDAFVRLKQFLGYKELEVMAGRQPVAWSLRNDHPGFLYDSQANHATVTSWDGLRAAYNLDTIDISPYAFRLPDEDNIDPAVENTHSTLYGVVVDWKPDNGGNNNQKLYFTASANLETDVLLLNGTARGKKLQTYYVGGDADLEYFELFGEFAMQRGDQDDDTKFRGYAFSGGIDWHADNSVVVGIQGDYLSGDDDATDATNHAFIANWEGMSDTFIVEHEKYGELSRLLDGNRVAGKAKVEYSLDDKKRVRVKAVYANYRIAKPAPGGSNRFGQEADLSLAWDYTPNATITLIGAGFKPGDGYVEASNAATGTTNAETDWIYLLAANLLVRF
jgi:hypothetical protein